MAEKLKIQMPEPLPRMPGETDREFGKRLAQEAMRLCDEGTRALRRPGSKPPAEPTEQEAVT